MFISLLNSPVQGIQGKDAQFAVEITVCTALEKELDPIQEYACREWELPRNRHKHPVGK